MAESKKSKSAKKNTSDKKKKAKAKGSSRNSKQQKISFYEAHRLTIMLVYIALSAVFLCFAFIRGYNISARIKGAFFAFFGMGFYVFAFLLLILGVRIALDNLKYNLVVTTVSGFGISAIVSSVVHLLKNSIVNGGIDEWTQQFNAAVGEGWNISYSGFIPCGGVLGALIGGGLLHTLGKAVTFIVLFLLLALCVAGYFNISFSSMGHAVSSLINGGKGKIDSGAQKINDKHTKNKEKRKAQKEERDRLKAQEEEKKKQEQERENPADDVLDDYDFNKTDVEIDYEEKRNSEDRSRRNRKPVKRNSIFTPYNPPEDIDDIDGKATGEEIDTDTNVDYMTPDTDPDEYSDDFDKCVDDISCGKEDPYSEIQGDARQIVDDAIISAENKQKQKQNRQEVESYSDKKAKKKEYAFPPIDCLANPNFSSEEDFALELRTTSKKLVDTLKSFGVETNLIGVSRGPSVTRYELQPAPGVKISKITNLADDIALNLASSGVRIEAPIPNKSAVGIEIPNRIRSTVTLREIVVSSDFKSAKSKLNVALGKDISGATICADLAKMPHLLIAGTTGSGKSVCLNCMIVSILYNAKPSEVKLLMIDPKQVEFSVYNGIPHLLVPVISDVRKAAGSLAWAVGEMENRYKTFSKCAVRDIAGYNRYVINHPEFEPMPQIVIFIDELNDLMMISPKEVEDSICRLAQKARAAGMHLVVATQRPSVDVITGIIKANIPSRISLSVSSQVDSRTILDTIGAEKLLGNGDMLYNPVGVSKPVRIQGAYLSDAEIEKIVDFIKLQEEVEYDNDVMDEIERNAVTDKKQQAAAVAGDGADDSDDMLSRAIDVAIECEVISVSLLQRKLRIGYARAARIVDQLDEKGLVGPSEGGGKPRKFLMTKAQYLEMKASGSAVSDSDDVDDYDILSD